MIIHEFDLAGPGPGSRDPADRTSSVAVDPGHPGAADQRGLPPGGRDRGSSGQEALDGGAPPAMSWIVLMLALALISAAAGAVLAAAPAGRVAPAPVAATVSARDVLATADGAQVVLRLTMENPGVSTASVTGLLLDGVTTRRVTIPLAQELPPGQSSTVDIPVEPDCAGPGRELQARVVASGDPRGVPVLAAVGLDGVTGLCGLADTMLPQGWRTSIPVAAISLEGKDLVLEAPGLATLDVSGVPPVNGLLQTSAQVGDLLLPATVEHGRRLRLTGPAPCTPGTRGTDGTSLPMSARLLVRSAHGLEQVLVQAGPALAQWLIGDCRD